MANIRERLPYHDASHPLIYGLAHFAFGQYLKYNFDIEIYGAQYLKRGEPRVYAPTHGWAMDPEILGVSAEGHVVPTMAKSELWTDDKYKKFGTSLGQIIGLVGAFPVKRGERDSTSYRIASSHPAEGRSVALFPQGTRRSGYENMHNGAARIAYRHNIPLQPLVIARFENIVRVIASNPIMPDRSMPQHAAVELMMDELQEKYETDTERALAWGEHDTIYPRHASKRFGRIKRYD